MAKKIGVILSGCGVYDGSEIHEAVITLLAIDRNGAEAVCMAPNIAQLHVVNHLTGEVATGESRNVLVEAARIARGKILPVSEVRAADLDAVMLPGGFGAAKNLSSFAVDGKGMKVIPQVEKLVKAVHAAGKPMGFICISPVIAAKVLGPEGVTVTIGNDKGTADAIASWGAKHVERPVDDIAIDKKLKVVSTPAYMLDSWTAGVYAGIDKLVAAVLEMT